MARIYRRKPRERDESASIGLLCLLIRQCLVGIDSRFYQLCAARAIERPITGIHTLSAADIPFVTVRAEASIPPKISIVPLLRAACYSLKLFIIELVQLVFHVSISLRIFARRLYQTAEKKTRQKSFFFIHIVAYCCILLNLFLHFHRNILVFCYFGCLNQFYIVDGIGNYLFIFDCFTKETLIFLGKTTLFMLKNVIFPKSLSSKNYGINSC